MGYGIHVERREGEPPITLAEWIAAVERAPSARIQTGVATLGRGITYTPGPGDTELYFADEGKWHPVFHCHEIEPGEARIGTRATALEEPVVLAFLRHVTAELGAIVRGDEGEEYDLATGEPVASDPTRRN